MNNIDSDKFVIHEIPDNDITNIEQVIVNDRNNCSLSLQKIYEYKDFIAISMIYLVKQLL